MRLGHVMKYLDNSSHSRFSYRCKNSKVENTYKTKMYHKRITVVIPATTGTDSLTKFVRYSLKNGMEVLIAHLRWLRDVSSKKYFLVIDLDGTGLKTFLNYMCDNGGTSFKINKLKIQVSLLPALRRLVEMLLVSHNTSPNHTQPQ